MEKVLKSELVNLHKNDMMINVGKRKIYFNKESLKALKNFSVTKDENGLYFLPEKTDESLTVVKSNIFSIQLSYMIKSNMKITDTNFNLKLVPVKIEKSTYYRLEKI